MSVWVLQEADTEERLGVESFFFPFFQGGVEEVMPVNDKVKGKGVGLSRETLHIVKKI